MSRATTLREPPSTIWNKLALTVAFLVGVGFVAGFVLPYFQLTEAALGRYSAKRAWLLLHISTGTVALLLGPFVLGLGLNRRRMQLHRAIGMAYIVSIALSAAAAFYLAFNTDLSWVFGMGLTGLAIAWIVTTSLAFVAIKKRLIPQHKEWMIRSYVVTLAFVNFRILVGILQAAGIGTVIEQIEAASWFCWAFPLLVTEAVLQGKKIVNPREATR